MAGPMMTMREILEAEGPGPMDMPYGAIGALLSRDKYAVPKHEAGEPFERYMERLAQSFQDWVNG